MRTATSSKLLLVLGPFLLTALTAQGEVATPDEMARVCQNWLTYVTDRTGGWAREAKPEITDVEDLVASDGKTVLGRCFSIAPRGFVVVPVLKELPPVKAYSDRNGLDVTETGGMPQLIREVLEDRVRLFKAQYGGLDASQPQRGEVLLGRAHRQRWDQLLVNPDRFMSNLDRATMDPLVEVGPLLTSDWHQGEPYWNTCPYGNGGQTYVGCVATAASQLMNYHQWPPNGVGNHSYYWQGDDCDGAAGPPYPGAAVLSADFSDAYDWANIPDDCSIGCTAAQEDALAELCYEVGVAYEMDYGACGSGAHTMQAAVILPRHFRYAPGIDVENRYFHTAVTWFSIIQDEINAGRPMLYNIRGHAIVCDGWRDTGGQNEYHMNYGWAGSQTAWFVIDDLYCPWSGCDPLVEQLARYIEPWQPADPDCNDNTFPDYQDIWDDTSKDCNGNAIPDECDIEDTTSPRPSVV